ncbi:MAG: hypothetical protein HOP11_06590 [Saprospiraceae bacterium]|nr:hypothetical protein [Saprospiraceae bacterium]
MQLKYLVLILFLSSCIVRENARLEKIIYLTIPEKDKYKLEVKFGETKKVFYKDLQFNLINVYKLNGGDSYFLGIIKIYDHNPDNEKHIIISDSTNKIINELSVNDILKFDFLTLDSLQIYILK